MSKGVSVDPWLWSVCTTARVWGDTLTSASEWLEDLASAAYGSARARLGRGRATGSTSAPPMNSAHAATATSSTRMPADWSCSDSG